MTLLPYLSAASLQVGSARKCQGAHENTLWFGPPYLSACVSIVMPGYKREKEAT